MSGLEGVVAAETSLSLVDGERGELIIAGYPVEEIAPKATFEEVVELLTGIVEDRQSCLSGQAGLPVLHGEPMDALRAGIAAMPSDS